MKKFFLGGMAGIGLTMFAWTYFLRYVILEAVVAALDSLLRSHYGPIKYHGMTQEMRREQRIRAASRR